MPPSYLIFGGTFDPVHLGHIKVATEVQRQFQFDHFIFLPCKLPLLKNKPHASPEQRVAMLELALREAPLQPLNFEIDTKEILRESPSFMVTTLEDYRNKLGNTVSLTLLMGLDTLAKLPRWYQWKKILKLANILVVDRPGYVALPGQVENLLKTHKTDTKEDVKNNIKGYVYHFNAGLYEEASSDLRKNMKQKFANNMSLPKSVNQYIKRHSLYAE